MSDYLDSQRGAMPPTFGTRHAPQILSGSGTAEDSNNSAFTLDRMHVLSVGATDLRVLFRAESGVAGAVDGSNGAYIAAGTLLRFRSNANARFVYVEAADGVADYEATVWQVEP